MKKKCSYWRQRSAVLTTKQSFETCLKARKALQFLAAHWPAVNKGAPPRELSPSSLIRNRRIMESSPRRLNN